MPLRSKAAFGPQAICRQASSRSQLPMWAGRPELPESPHPVHTLHPSSLRPMPVPSLRRFLEVCPVSGAVEKTMCSHLSHRQGLPGRPAECWVQQQLIASIAG